MPKTKRVLWVVEIGIGFRTGRRYLPAAAHRTEDKAIAIAKTTRHHNRVVKYIPAK